MSADNQKPVDQEDQPAESSQENQELTSTHQTKLEVHNRDRHQCLNCRKSIKDDISRLDADHIVPEGSGGAGLHRNLATLCRDCHEAKHDEDAIAPTIRFTSTGDMDDEEFRWYRHFWNEVLPALAEAAVGHRVEPLLGLDDHSMWDGRHIPMGAVRFCDESLSERDDVEYSPMNKHRYR
jgi:hypothetical protein